ncbi:cardiolipin synthase [Cryobacterium psychrophilum]|uniref:Cardiolipin synthase n=1 Tax=Cryobacterium psychrophilum TaxID=41988 RepID=A0A4Y8KUC7_9MICO|nr:cardiolipin synthase [Cryobacterium psychrophilum]TDW28809.1 cardiolipin synthetase 2 [Cryobacterium psychrophilum]TFD82453.1 cardiolipin synthase [Cryobacterium psychrophilum]
MNSQQVTLLVWVLVTVVDLAIRIAAIIIIPRSRKPSAAMAWLLAVFLIPFVGVFFFLLIGSSKLPKRRRDKQQRISQLISESVAGMDLVNDDDSWPRWFASVVELNTSLGSVPIVGGNTARLIGDYNASIAAMAAEIQTSTRFVHVEFYIVSFDATTRDFFAAMEAAVRRGVTVRVLLDHIASIRTAGHDATFAELDRIGVIWSFMLPVQPLKGKYQRPDLRNHRKLVVVDGRVAFMGSQNLIDRSYNSAKNQKRGLQWQELVTQVTGPVVSGINLIFLSDWYSETDEMLRQENVPADTIPMDVSSRALDCQVVPSGPGFEGENNLRLFLALLYSAQERIIITSPYFVPDEAMLYAITSSCQRGLTVELFVSELGDQGSVYHAQRSYYSALLKAGVRIWLYPAPFILHAKHFSIDDDVAVIGSSNMDIRSFSLNLEVSLMVRGQSFVADMRQVEEGYRRISRELTLTEWQKEPLRSTMLDGVARLTSALQ